MRTKAMREALLGALLGRRPSIHSKAGPRRRSVPGTKRSALFALALSAPFLPVVAASQPAAAVAVAVAGTTCTASTCIHVDPAPPGIDIRRPRSPLPAARSALESEPAAPTPICTGDGTSGPRVQLVYARPQGAPDRYDTFATSFQTWAAEMDATVKLSAEQTGGVRRIRFVHKASCIPTISRVVVPAENFGAQIRALHGDRTDRRYMVWMDATEYCGVGDFWPDDQPGWRNWNNAGPGSFVARVDSGCWGIPGALAETHELFHTLGAVQNSAPHSTKANHCYDEIDRMCGGDGSGVPLVTACPDGREDLLDCGHDDYFHTDPAPGSYLATHWNTADSRFLTGPPAAPSDVGAVSTNSSAMASWSGPAVGPPEITGFEVTAIVNGAPAPPVSLAADARSYSPPPLPDGASIRFRVSATNEYGVGRQSPPTPAVVVGDGSRFHPLPPARILDTRTGNGAPAAGVLTGATLDVQVTGRGGVPGSGVEAVVLNLTVTEAWSGGYMTAWPTGESRPLASNLNFGTKQTVANLVTVKVGAAGKVSLYNGGGPTYAIADVAGWYGSSASPAGSRFHPVAPTRLLDTRAGNGAPVAKVTPATPLNLQVAGRGGLPSTGVSAVVLNVTVTEPSTGGYLTAWPTGDSRPLASNLNFSPNQTVPNLVTVKVGAGGKVSLYQSGAGAHLVADVAGWFGPDGESSGARYHPVAPARILDTRLPLLTFPPGMLGPGVPVPPPQYPNLVAPGVAVQLQVAGQGGVPLAGASAVILNVTAVDPAAGGYLTVWPAGDGMPDASNLNFVRSGTVPNLVVAKLGADGKVGLFNGSAGSVHLVADVAGWYGPG